jgi:hypothetical protein
MIASRFARRFYGPCGFGEMRDMGVRGILVYCAEP